MTARVRTNSRERCRTFRNKRDDNPFNVTHAPTLCQETLRQEAQTTPRNAKEKIRRWVKKKPSKCLKVRLNAIAMRFAMLSPARCCLVYAVAMLLPRCCHAVAVPLLSCGLPCGLLCCRQRAGRRGTCGGCVALRLPCGCHAFAMRLPCKCHAFALRLPYCGRALAM